MARNDGGSSTGRSSWWTRSARTSPTQPSALTPVTGSGVSCPRWTSSSSSAAVGGSVCRCGSRRRNSRPARSRSASTLIHRPRSRTSGVFAATSLASSSSPISWSPTAIDQRNAASSSRPTRLRVTTCSDGVLWTESRSPSRRRPSQVAGSCTSNPASISRVAPEVRNRSASSTVRSYSDGWVRRKAGASIGSTSAARPSSATNSPLGSLTSPFASPDQICPADSSRLGSAVARRRNCSCHLVPSPVWSSRSSSAGRRSVPTSASRKHARPSTTSVSATSSHFATASARTPSSPSGSSTRATPPCNAASHTPAAPRPPRRSTGGSARARRSRTAASTRVWRASVTSARGEAPVSGAICSARPTGGMASTSASNATKSTPCSTGRHRASAASPWRTSVGKTRPRRTRSAARRATARR